jgi:hypothetical protein
MPRKQFSKVRGVNARVLVFGVGAIAGICAIVGAVSAWVHVEGGSVEGFDANAGKTTLIASAVAIVVAGASVRFQWLALMAAIPAGIAGAVSGWYAADPDEFVKGLNADIAWGLVLSPIGAIVLFVCCVVLAILPPRRTTTATAV